MAKMYIFPCLLLAIFLSIDSAAAQNTVQKSHCLSAVGGENIDILKKKLLAGAKRDAVSEIFGELITSFTKIDSGLLTEDKLKLASSGFIRIKGNPKFRNGTNFGELCVSIEAYATDDDRKKFEPIKVRNKYCATNPEFTTRQIKEYAKKQSIINAVIKHNRNLESYAEETVLKLVHEVKYLEEGFIPETETYCSKVEGLIYPVELAAVINTNPSSSRKTALYKSCKEILENNQSSKDGIYEIDADGADGSLQPFKVYCNMSTEGGGWTLYANHRDGLAEVKTRNPVTKTDYGVLESERWLALRDSMSTGMMFIDEHGRVATISASKLKNSRCTSILTTVKLTEPPHKGTSIWHTENSGCDGRGGDYSIINLAGQRYKYYARAGAALYQYSSVKFDKWPYHGKVSYKNQNSLLYFIK